jgi:hypothetical protein
VIVYSARIRVICLLVIKSSFCAYYSSCRQIKRSTDLFSTVCSTGRMRTKSNSSICFGSGTQNWRGARSNLREPSKKDLCLPQHTRYVKVVAMILATVVVNCSIVKFWNNNSWYKRSEFWCKLSLKLCINFTVWAVIWFIISGSKALFKELYQIGEWDCQDFIFRSHILLIAVSNSLLSKFFH